MLMHMADKPCMCGTVAFEQLKITRVNSISRVESVWESGVHDLGPGNHGSKVRGDCIPWAFLRALSRARAYASGSACSASVAVQHIEHPASRSWCVRLRKRFCTRREITETTMSLFWM